MSKERCRRYTRRAFAAYLDKPNTRSSETIRARVGILGCAHVSGSVLKAESASKGCARRSCEQQPQPASWACRRNRNCRSGPLPVFALLLRGALLRKGGARPRRRDLYPRLPPLRRRIITGACTAATTRPPNTPAPFASAFFFLFLPYSDWVMAAGEGRARASLPIGRAGSRGTRSNPLTGPLKISPDDGGGWWKDGRALRG